MSEITPASNPNHASNFSHKTATGVDLAPVTIIPSQILWRIELVFYLSFFCAVTIALFPFLLSALYWPVLWLIFLLLIVFVLFQRWRAQKLSAISLSVQKKIWRLKHSAGEFTVVPFGEILMWAGVIILPVREALSGRKHYIVALPDSMNAEDWRHLRVWLRTGLRNNI